MTEENQIPFCECDEVHLSEVESRRKDMPALEKLYELSDFFKILSDSTRMSILFAIDQGPLCVCDIAHLLGMTKSAVSHQLKILRRGRIFSTRLQTIT